MSKPHPNSNKGKLLAQANNLGLPVSEDNTESEIARAIQDYENAIEAAKNSKEDSPESAVVKQAIKGAATAEVDGKKVIQVSEDVFASMGAAIAKAIVEGNKEAMKPDRDARGQFTPESIPADDDMGEEKMFFAHRSFHVVGPKSINGIPVQMPYGRKAVRFTMLYGVTRRSGNQEDVSYICVFSTRSKSLYEYMKTHHEFNRRFFEEPGRAVMIPEQARRAQIFGRHLSTLSAMASDKVTAKAHAMGMKISSTTSLADVRSLIADALTEQEMATAANWQNQLNQETSRNAAIVQGLGG